LLSIFIRIDSEYDGQAIPAYRFEEIMKIIKKPIFDLLDAEGGPAETILERLNVLMRKFKLLSLQ
jgi:hypothetical protein